MVTSLSIMAAGTQMLSLHCVDLLLAERRWSVKCQKEKHCSPLSGECRGYDGWRDLKISSHWTQSLQQPSPRCLVVLHATSLHTNQISYKAALLETSGGISALFQEEKQEWHSAHFSLGHNTADSNSLNTRTHKAQFLKDLCLIVSIECKLQCSWELFSVTWIFKRASLGWIRWCSYCSSWCSYRYFFPPLPDGNHEISI